MKEKVFKFIKQFIKENGYPPTVREIAEGCGNRSTSTAYTYLQVLRLQGYIGFADGKPRTIVILKEMEVGKV